MATGHDDKVPKIGYGYNPWESSPERRETASEINRRAKCLAPRSGMLYAAIVSVIHTGRSDRRSLISPRAGHGRAIGGHRTSMRQHSTASFDRIFLSYRAPLTITGVFRSVRNIEIDLYSSGTSPSFIAGRSCFVSGLALNTRVRAPI